MQVVVSTDIATELNRHLSYLVKDPSSCLASMQPDCSVEMVDGPLGNKAPQLVISFTIETNKLIQAKFKYEESYGNWSVVGRLVQKDINNGGIETPYKDLSSNISNFLLDVANEVYQSWFDKTQSLLIEGQYPIKLCRSLNQIAECLRRAGYDEIKISSELDVISRSYRGIKGLIGIHTRSDTNEIWVVTASGEKHISFREHNPELYITTAYLFFELEANNLDLSESEMSPSATSYDDAVKLFNERFQKSERAQASPTTDAEYLETKLKEVLAPLNNILDLDRAKLQRAEHSLTLAIPFFHNSQSYTKWMHLDLDRPGPQPMGWFDLAQFPEQLREPQKFSLLLKCVYQYYSEYSKSEELKNWAKIMLKFASELSARGLELLPTCISGTVDITYRNGDSSQTYSFQPAVGPFVLGDDFETNWLNVDPIFRDQIINSIDSAFPENFLRDCIVLRIIYEIQKFRETQGSPEDSYIKFIPIWRSLPEALKQSVNQYLVSDTVSYGNELLSEWSGLVNIYEEQIGQIEDLPEAQAIQFWTQLRTHRFVNYFTRS